MYLHCLTCDHPGEWIEWFPWAEYCYNTSFQRSIKTSPFHVVYGRTPPSLVSYEPGSARVEAVERSHVERDEFLKEIHDRLLQAIKEHDTYHRDLEFAVGDWVWLRLHNRQAASLAVKAHAKLAPKYYGLYQVLERIGAVAYRLHLPTGACIHACCTIEEISWRSTRI